MSLAVLDDKLWFPKPDKALSDGLLAIGGNISIERLLLAYKQGIFPWYDGNIPLWWHPNPRFVLFPNEIKISKSMKSILAKNHFEFSINTSFKKVVQACKKAKRKDQDGTWINDEFIEVYHQLHQLKFGFSAETWLNGNGFAEVWCKDMAFPSDPTTARGCCRNAETSASVL